MSNEQVKMNIDTAKRIIEERGYFEIVFEPAIYEKNLLCNKELNCSSRVKDVIDKAQVQLRGWYYPHINRATKLHQDAPYAVHDGVEQWIVWELHREVWRMYYSGQFIHRFSLVEDWLKEGSWHQSSEIVPGTKLDVIGVLYRFIEITQFIKNIFEKGYLDCDGGKLSIALYNSEGRQLEVLFDQSRAGLLDEYKTRTNPIKIEKVFSKREVLENYEELSIELCSKFFSFFNWDNQPLQTFREEQRKFLSRQI